MRIALIATLIMVIGCAPAMTCRSANTRTTGADYYTMRVNDWIISALKVNYQSTISMDDGSVISKPGIWVCNTGRIQGGVINSTQ